MTSVALPILGLAGDQNPSAAPKGAMSEADNVVCDLPGQARPRPNHEVVYSNGAAVSKCDAVLSFDGEWLAHDSTGGWRNAVGVLTTLGGVTTADASDISASESQGAQARGSMYISSLEGMLRVGSSAATQIHPVVMDMPVVPSRYDLPVALDSPTPGLTFNTPISAGYRWVLKRTDENGYVKRGPPSPVTRVRSSEPVGGSADFAIMGTDLASGAYRVQAWMGEGLVAGDEIEFYRTKTVADADAVLPPDYYLVYTHKVTAADVTAGYVSAPDVIFDTTPDDMLGEALYTNPGQGGALSTKLDPPHRPVAVAQWNRCMWIGDAYERPAAKIIFSNPSLLAAVSIASGVVTSGLNTITGVASVTGLMTGMVVNSNTSSWGSPATAKITSITGAGPYTITMDTVAVNSGTVGVAGYTLTAYHQVTINDVVFLLSDGSTLPSYADVRVTLAALLAWEIREASLVDPPVICRTSADAQAGVAGSGSPGEVTIEMSVADTNLVITTSAEDGAFVQLSRTSGITVAPRRRGNRLWWSAPDEPEAFPLLNYVDLGDQRAAIRRIVPLRDAMLVFTTAGLYRVSGTPPGNWSVDLLDPTLTLVRAEAVDALDSVAFALTNRGVAMVNESGVARVASDGKVEEDIAPTIKLCLDDSAQRGARVLCWEREGLVLVALPTVPVAETSPCSSEVLCYAPKTGSWTRWPDQYWYAGVSNGISGYPYVAATRPDQLPLYEIRQFVEPRGYDNDWPAIAVTSGAGTTSLVISDAARGSWYPRSGDWLLVGTAPNVWRRVTGVVDDGATWTLTLDTASPSPLATFTAYEGAPVLLEWLPSAMGANEPFMVGTWREAVFSFYGGPADSGEVKDANARIVFGVRHDGTDTPVELVGTPARSIVQLRPYRFGWPRNASRRGVCFPRLSFSEIDWLPRISGVLLVGDAVSERVRR